MGGEEGGGKSLFILLLLLAPKPSLKAVACKPNGGCTRLAGEERHPPRTFLGGLNAATFAVQGLSRRDDKSSGTSEAACSEPAAPACCLITPAEAFPALPGRARQCDHASGFLARKGLPLAPRQRSPSPPENSAPFF